MGEKGLAENWTRTRPEQAFAPQPLSSISSFSRPLSLPSIVLLSLSSSPLLFPLLVFSPIFYLTLKRQ